MELVLTVFGAAFLSFGLTVLSQSAEADVIFTPSVFYESEDRTDQAGVVGNADVRQLVIDFRLGYQFPSNGFFLGGMYKLEDTKYSGGDLKGFAVGPSIGFLSGGFIGVFTYHVLAERTYTFSGTESRYTEGRGFQFDVAYAYTMGSNFGLGPQLTYQSIKFNKSRVGSGAEASRTLEVTQVRPGFTFYFSF